MNRLFLFLSLLFLVCYGVFSQRTESMQSHSCDHHPCARAKQTTVRDGVYPQNPLLWKYNVHFYGLDVEVSPEETGIKGRVTVGAKVAEAPLDTFVLELKNNMQVDSVMNGQQPLNFAHQQDELLVVLPEALSKGEYLSLVVHYQGQPEGSGFFTGFQTGLSPFGKPVLWTLSQPTNARQWWPVKQVLEDKADSVAVTVTTPAGFMAASNGLLQQVDTLENKIRYHWRSHYPIAYYLISLAVASYTEYNFEAPVGEEGEVVFVQNFIYDDPSYLEAQQENINRTKDFMAIFSDLFGLYPFREEKYGHATAPMGGGMEHQTMTTQANFGMDLTAHELAHQWFGNNVTCATWSDIWINEGFASYGEFLAREFLYGQPSAQTWMRNAHNSVISQPGGSVYVPPTETHNLWRIFNGRLSYRKGAAIIHLLRHEIYEDPLFFNTLKSFQEAFKDSVATGDDFKMIVEKETGNSWDWFFDQWYYGEGYPVFDIRWYSSDDSLFIHSRQHNAADNNDFFLVTLPVAVVSHNDTLHYRFLQNQRSQTFHIPFGGVVREILFDPDEWLFKEAVIRKDLTEGELVNADVYPVPFNDRFYIYLDRLTGDEAFAVFDLKGKEVLRGRITERVTHVIMPPMGISVYLLKITRGNQAPFKTKIMQQPF